ncbi:uncharacterized protein LOC131936709 [Physella acuta]|uniref:uncharacterized protein LOC131936709 n=1 Tax=Physella acuta TaxID=109671 RepID=UPI0027DD3447|nr:uncharacterized protein LOC131936709 [Physella acuta]XP_059149735.1 uncharacterized protein LOC131936709 [Physella acuta]
MDETEMAQNFHGNFEIQEFEKGQGEGQVKSCLANCKKNPGHKKFIPVPNFRLHHLPDDVRDDDVYRLILALADLTVRIYVTTLSPHRPEYVPGTSQPYPGHGSQGSSMGSGRIRSVSKKIYTVCPLCKTSGSCCTGFREVKVYTATHVVYDNTEVANTVCRLDYNTDTDTDTPVNIDGWRLATDNDLDIVKTDRCEFSCATHDMQLADDLQRKLELFDLLRRRVTEKFRESRDGQRLTVIVSHPHGSIKQVSVGRWTGCQTVADNETTYTYTTCTCPGSSGAPVYKLGRWWFRWHAPVHSGFNGQLNYSGAGYED